MYRVVAFDISDDKKRAKVAKLLESYGVRVQKSVFEIADLSERGFLKLRSRLEGLVDSSTDSIIYYTLCKTCHRRIERWGVGRQVEVPQVGETVRIIGS